jgi:hypothetical protein
MSKFVEFLGASGGMVFINADNIDAISAGTPERMPSGVFMDRVHVYLKEGANVFGTEREEPYVLFYVEDDYLSYWLEHWRTCLGIPEFPNKEEEEEK